MTGAVPLARLRLGRDDTRKINQYLDVTRAAMLFAHRIILVEGIAEAVLLPVMARHWVFGGNAAKYREFHAVTIVNVGSVDFEPYVRLLLGSVDGLTIVDNLVVITDGDPALPGDDETDSQVTNRADQLNVIASGLNAASKLTVAEAAYTLEADLLNGSANAAVLKSAYLKQHPRSENKWRQIANAPDQALELYKRLRSDKRFISKGEFAHDIALAIQDGQPFVVPEYLRRAIVGVLARP